MQGVKFESVEDLKKAAQIRREGADFMDYITEKAGNLWIPFFFVDYSDRLGRYVLLRRSNVDQTREEFQELAEKLRAIGDQFYAMRGR